MYCSRTGSQKFIQCLRLHIFRCYHLHLCLPIYTDWFHSLLFTGALALWQDGFLHCYNAKPSWPHHLLQRPGAYPYLHSWAQARQHCDDSRNLSGWAISTSSVRVAQCISTPYSAHQQCLSHHARCREEELVWQWDYREEVWGWGERIQFYLFPLVLSSHNIEYIPRWTRSSSLLASISLRIEVSSLSRMSFFLRMWKRWLRNIPRLLRRCFTLPRRMWRSTWRKSRFQWRRYSILLSLFLSSDISNSIYLYITIYF